MMGLGRRETKEKKKGQSHSQIGEKLKCCGKYEITKSP